MLTHEENRTLCATGPGTPMGRVLRSYWIPALRGDELEAGGAPKRVRLLSEDLVAFRGHDGTTGLLAEGCPHRNASLALARNEGCALTCLYHGWRVGADGRLLDVPTMPDGGAALAERVRQPAYPTVELGGFVWAYLGDAATPPPVPDFEFTSLPASHVSVLQIREDANWVQALEGVLDSAHTNFLHVDTVVPSADTTSTDYGNGALSVRASADGRPKLEVEDTDHGFRYAAIRVPLRDPDRWKYVRTTLYIAPFYGMNAQPPGWGQVQIFVPIDDEHTMFYNLRYASLSTGPIPEAMHANIAEKFGGRVGIDVDEDHRKTANAGNLWNQDRDAMRAGTTAAGIRGVAIQDMACQESMGPITDRTKEHLGPTDLAIIRLRRLLLDAAAGLASGTSPVGIRTPFDYASLRAHEGLVALDEPWQSVEDVVAGVLSGRGA